jgi:hypothetical protein
VENPNRFKEVKLESRSKGIRNQEKKMNKSDIEQEEDI